MTPEQVATNARAVRAVAERLEREGHAAPEVLADELTALLARHGWKPTEPPPPLHGPASSEAGRKAARRLFEQTRREKGSKR